MGIALSDESGSIAKPLKVIAHESRNADAEAISKIAEVNHAELIIVGQALDMDGKATPQGRSAARLASAIKNQTQTPVKLWDESDSTKSAKSTHIKMGITRKKRKGHLDEYAAAVILQSYLDVQAM